MAKDEKSFIDLIAKQVGSRLCVGLLYSLVCRTLGQTVQGRVAVVDKDGKTLINLSRSCYPDQQLMRFPVS